MAILIAMLVVSAMEWIPLFQASFIAAGLMIATGCVRLKIARRSIEYPVLAGIAASFALGFALDRVRRRGVAGGLDRRHCAR